MRGLRPRNSERDTVRNPVEECSLGRRPASETEVTFDDKILDPRTDLRELSRTGFEWGADGAGPMYLVCHFCGSSRATYTRPAGSGRNILSYYVRNWSITSNR